jgi:hypothetical protein
MIPGCIVRWRKGRGVGEEGGGDERWIVVVFPTLDLTTYQEVPVRQAEFGIDGQQVLVHLYLHGWVRGLEEEAAVVVAVLRVVKRGEVG